MNQRLGEKGITLLLVVVILSAVLSISIGIFGVIFGQLLISGEAGDSLRALYAADQGVERTLYRDRTGRAVPEQGNLANGYAEDSREANLRGGGLAAGSCYTAQAQKNSATRETTITVTGQYRELSDQAICGAGSDTQRVVKRRFEVRYSF